MTRNRMRGFGQRERHDPCGRSRRNGQLYPCRGRIGIPKSTVSQRIAQLEARLGLRLLNRSTRHVSLTGSGQVYLDYCRRVRAEVSAANMARTYRKEQPVGTLKITCPD
ncbi:LysR family transcriptional regulator [Mesorhizobium sp. M0220]|uniref:LysR family transcriptional regulator n=1 Tax=Mesorhizobium sp. M0220 TaxID=2956920 RepID=UPI003339B3AE